MSFEQGDNSWWRRLWWGWCLSNYVKISKENQGGPFTGEASLGKSGCAYLEMDDQHATDELWFNHEMGHTFGLLHEHERCDRYQYVGNPPGSTILCRYRTKFYFLWWSWYEYVDNASTEDTPDDYHSIMHYPSRPHDITAKLPDGTWAEWDTHEVKNNGVTVQSNNMEWGSKNGDTWYTPWDIYTIKRLYGKTTNRIPTTYTTPAPAFP